MKKDIAVYTNNGGHDYNEDSFACGENVFAVADGLGGHENSKVASQYAADYIVKNADFASALIEGQIPNILEKLNTAIVGMQKKTGNLDSRTTIAAAWTGGEKFNCANVGDSRVYYFRRGRVLFQSVDHSVCQASVMNGEMDRRDIRRSPDRAKLLKVLGEEKPLNLRPYSPIDIYEGDAFLICSDGFWDYVYEEEMEIDLHKSSSAREWMDYMLKRQLERAHNKGDNYTLICGIVSEGRKLPAISMKKLAICGAAAIAALAVVAVSASLVLGRLFQKPEEEAETIETEDVGGVIAEESTVDGEVSVDSESEAESVPAESESDAAEESAGSDSAAQTEEATKPAEDDNPIDIAGDDIDNRSLCINGQAHISKRWVLDKNGKGNATHSGFCETCQKQITEAHDFAVGKVITEPTETEKGLMAYVCLKCGYNQEKTIPPHTHEYGEWTNANSIEHRRTCSGEACGKWESEEHTFDSGKVTKHATESEAGVKTYTCTVCGAEKTEAIPKLKPAATTAATTKPETTAAETKHTHSFGEWSKTDDKNHTRECSCGEKETEGHSFDAGKVTKKATETEEGVKTYTCTVCDGTKTTPIQKKEPAETEEETEKESEEETTETTAETADPNHVHSFGEWQNSGGLHTRECSCGHTEDENHKYTGIETKAPTTTAPGEMTYTCTVCGHSYTEEISEHVHSYNGWTDKGDGNHIGTCTCGKTDEREHRWDEGKVTTAPTYTAEGVKTYTCEDCGETKPESIPKLVCEQHVGTWTPDEDGTTHSMTCTICNQPDTKNHVGGQWNSDGNTHKKCCTECGFEMDSHEASGDWKNNDDRTHSRTCTTCEFVDSENHKPQEQSSLYTLYDDGRHQCSCTECGGTIVEPHTDENADSRCDKCNESISPTP